MRSGPAGSPRCPTPTALTSFVASLLFLLPRSVSEVLYDSRQRMRACVCASHPLDGYTPDRPGGVAAELAAIAARFSLRRARGPTTGSVPFNRRLIFGRSAKATKASAPTP